MTSTKTWTRTRSFLGTVVLVLATGPAAGQTVAEPPATDEKAILETAYPDYDATRQDVPLRWKTAPVPWFDPAVAEATHVLLQVVATKAWGASDVLVLTALRYDTRTTEDGRTTRVVMESKAELLFVRRDGPVILSRADLGVLQLHDMHIFRSHTRHLESGFGRVHRGTVDLLQRLAGREHFKRTEAPGFHGGGFQVHRRIRVARRLVFAADDKRNAALGR